jgi:uncharacterized protein
MTGGVRNDLYRRVKYRTSVKLTQDMPGGPNLIRAYSSTALRVGERTLTTSLIVSADTLIEGWRPRSIEEMSESDLQPVLALRPEVLLIGSGPRQRFPGRDLFAVLYGARIGFEIMDTGAACRTYNVLVAEDRRVAAALILERTPA